MAEPLKDQPSKKELNNVKLKEKAILLSFFQQKFLCFQIYSNICIFM